MIRTEISPEKKKKKDDGNAKKKKNEINSDLQIENASKHMGRI